VKLQSSEPSEMLSFTGRTYMKSKKKKKFNRIEKIMEDTSTNSRKTRGYSAVVII
jgi:hypothetical protein